MSSSKLGSRSGAVKKESGSRYGTRLMALEKGKRINTKDSKESNSRKSCDCLQKSDNWKPSKLNQNSKVPVKKTNGKAVNKDGKKGSSDHHEKVVIVSKRSSSVSVVKSCNLRKSVSVRKVSYSTSVVLSSEEDDSDTEEEEEESESEEEERKSRSKRKTVVKRTTSKVKSSYQKNNKSDRAAKKARAIKLLCEKLSSSNKSKDNERELRPRFPYSMLQEWPTARAHRMASLNALAKVHVLYENESRTTGENLKDADETSLIDFLNEENSDDDDDDDDDDDESVHMVIRSSNSERKNDRSRNNDREKSRAEKKPKPPPPPPPKKSVKRKNTDVEIIDTRVCKRMASLNAQAILAASYITEPKPKRDRNVNRKFDKHVTCPEMDVKVVLESKCDVEIIETEKQRKSPKKESNDTCDENERVKSPDIHINECSKMSDSTDISNSYSPPASHSNNWRLQADIPSQENIQDEIKKNESIVTSTTSSTKVGVTQYTEVTKVQINSRNDLEVKEESKSERKIERILENDDVAITQMYHYQSKNANESYCVQMQTTYKPGSRNLSPAALPLTPPTSLHPHMSDPVLHGRPNFYGCSSHSPMLPAPPYHMSPSVGGMHPVMGMDHRIPHQYGGSAFSVPHYRHPQPIQFPHGEYGYYQPAGPLIQSHHDQYTIHKPVPYHPQPQLHQPPSRPQPPSSHRDTYNSLDAGRLHQKNSALPTHASAKSSSALPLHSSLSETSHSSYKSSLERSPSERIVNNLKPVSFSNSPRPLSPSHLNPQYPVQSNYRDYHRQKSPSSGGNYPKQYDPNVPPPSQNYNVGLPHSTSYQKHRQGHLECRESAGNHDSLTIDQQQFTEVPHHPSYSGSRDKIINDTYIKDSSWSIKTNPEDSPNTPVSFLPYQIDPNKDTSDNLSETSKYPLRPPSVIEIVEENSRDTKTYIQLEVPKNSYREKIVVVDVENDEINKDCLPSNVSKSHFDVSQEKTQVNEIKEPIISSADVKKDESSDIINSKNPVPNTAHEKDEKCDSLKESPEIMVIEVKKKKESAVVRRARLHGKQRTFRDAYNRPLVPLSKVKKSEASVSEENSVKSSTSEVSAPLSMPPPKATEKKFAHGWSWEGQNFEKQVYVSNDESPCVRQCYPAIKHVEGDVIHVRDCVLLRSGPRKTDLPFVAKITALWENPADGEMTMSLMWYYRPEHTETEKKLHHMEDEIFASKHKDTNSVACIEDKCYVLTYSEYCRYRKRCKLIEDSATSPTSIVPEIDDYPRLKRLPPPNVSPDLVFFCRKVYDFRQKRLLKNPV